MEFGVSRLKRGFISPDNSEAGLQNLRLFHFGSKTGDSFSFCFFLSFRAGDRGARAPKKEQSELWKKRKKSVEWTPNSRVVTMLRASPARRARPALSIGGSRRVHPSSFWEHEQGIARLFVFCCLPLLLALLQAAPGASPGTSPGTPMANRSAAK